MRILFILIFLFLIYSCYGINEHKAVKNEIFSKTQPQNGNCQFYCILIPNCKSYEDRNGTCFYTVKWLSTQPLTEIETQKSNRTKRKSGRFRGVSSARSSSFLSSMFGGGSSSLSRGSRNSGGGFFFFFFGGYRRHTIGSILFGWFMLLLLGAILVCALFFAILKAKEACFNP